MAEINSDLPTMKAYTEDSDLPDLDLTKQETSLRDLVLGETEVVCQCSWSSVQWSLPWYTDQDSNGIPVNINIHW